MSWDYSSREFVDAGIFAVLVKRGLSEVTNVTFFRGVQTVVQEFTYADPFQDATAQVRFPAVTGFDGNGGDTWWLEEFTNLDIYWLQATEDSWGSVQQVLNPLSTAQDWWLHHSNPDGSGLFPVWEGYIASYELTEQGAVVTCQGFLYQLDKYTAKPFYPSQPWPQERLIQREFSKSLHDRPDPRKGLLAKTLRDEDILFPPDWNRKVTKQDIRPLRSLLTPTNMPVEGANWTGHFSRNTGSFDPALTGYVQGLLSIMYADDTCFVEPDDPRIGSQWTMLRHPHERRRPILSLRLRDRVPDFQVWYGQPGVTASLTRDGHSIVRTVFGEGTGFDGVEWRGYEYVGKRSRVRWYPLYSAVDWPYEWAENNEAEWPVESFQKFPPGINQEQATKAAITWVNRDADPGWSGTITLKVAPQAYGEVADRPDEQLDREFLAPFIDRPEYPAGFSMWRIRAGMKIRLKGFYGSGASGIDFHIAEVTCNPEDNSVTLRVDTKYRDLLTLEQVQAMTRDPLTPVKALQINKKSVTIDDLISPWDYARGSGFMPLEFKSLFDLGRRQDEPIAASFPWGALTELRPPTDCYENSLLSSEGPLGGLHDGGKNLDDHAIEGRDFYVPVNAGNDTKRKRWSFFPVRTASAGTIARVEAVVYGWNGEILPTRFHLSFYKWRIGTNDMPKDDNGDVWPFFPGAFEVIRDDGTEKEGADSSRPAPNLLIGWGNEPQPAGYSPGSYSEGAKPTGKLLDSSPWPFSNVSDDRDDIPPQIITEEDPVESSQIELWAAVYVDLDVLEESYSQDWVFLVGRLYKQVQA